MSKGRTTMKQIAHELGITPSTVSLVMKDDRRISEETKQRVLAKAKELNFHLTPHIALVTRQKTMNIGVSIYGFEYATHPFHGKVIEGIETAAERHGYSMILSSNSKNRAGHSRKSYFMSLVEEGKIDGLIIHRGEREDLLALKEMGVPFVLMHTHYDYLPDVPAVHVDFRHAIREAASYLIETLGHRNIGFIGTHLDDEVGRRGLEGFREALDKNGLDFDESLVRIADYDNPGQEFKVAHELLSKADRPTAIVTVDDYFSMYAMNAAYELGLSVPEDVSITGVYDYPTSAMLPKPLTTIRIPLAEMGMKAFELLSQQMQGEPAEQKTYWFKGELITRKTTRFAKS